MNKEGKLRVSLLVQMAVFFLISIIAMVLITGKISDKVLAKIVIEESGFLAGTAAEGAIEYVRSSSGDVSVFRSAAVRDAGHRTFIDLCDKSGLKYIYLYTIDENEVRHYLLAAGRTPEDDELINTRLPYGATDDGPLWGAERVALSGDMDNAYEYVNNAFGEVCMWVYPVKDDAGNVYAILGADYSISRLNNLMNRYSGAFRKIIALLMLIVFAIFLILIRVLALKPINSLSHKMKMFVKDKTARLQIRDTVFADEITDIEGSFDVMMEDITNYIKDIRSLTEQRVHDQTQLEVARKIQVGIVPETMSLSEAHYNIAGYSFPAKDVSGDFYDIFKLDDDRICLIEGDISGKGITAALFMVMVRSAIRQSLKVGRGVGETLNNVNDEICLSNPECMFATVFAAIFNVKTGELTFSNAGHNPPVIIGKDTHFLEMDSGLALGLFEDAGLMEESVFLDRGEGILVYTDGITETINKSEQQYGEERLRNFADKGYAEGKLSSPLELLNDIRDDVRSFSEGLEQFDDITCVLLTYNGKSSGSLELARRIEEFDKVKDLVREQIFDEDKAKKIILACDELFANIVTHSEAEHISFDWEKKDGIFEITISDDGASFDPVGAAEIKKKFEDLDTGGMGIKLVKQYVSNISYKRIDGKIH